MVDGSTRTESVRGRAQALVVLLGIALVLYWTFQGTGFWLNAQLSGVRSGAAGLETLRQAVTIQGTVVALYVPTVLAAAVTAGMWVARAHRNATALVPGSQRFPRGLAAWSVVIPLANLVLVPMTVTDLWRASRPGRPANPRGPVGLVRAWTASAVLSFAVFIGGGVYRVSSSRLDDVALTNAGTVLLVILGTTTIVLFARTVLRISAWQEGRTVEPPARDGVASDPQTT